MVIAVALWNVLCDDVAAATAAKENACIRFHYDMIGMRTWNRSVTLTAETPPSFPPEKYRKRRRRFSSSAIDDVGMFDKMFIPYCTGAGLWVELRLQRRRRKKEFF